MGMMEKRWGWQFLKVLTFFHGLQWAQASVNMCTAALTSLPCVISFDFHNNSVKWAVLFSSF